MNLEIINDDHLLPAEREDWIRKLVEFAAAKLELPAETEMSISLITDDKIREINREYRDKDRVTDVISFAIEDDEADEWPNFRELEDELDIPRNIGDLFIAPGHVAEQAKTYEHSFDREFGYTVVHGFLHLNGYDHIEPADEQVMIKLQEEILDAYGLKR
ncbi:rRNA maturation RNase YbeY [Lapidilactobacillus achengensis]|uniref:Endoribonuclease YbeY n=1 Tax=Lapidilactobacillus achengensis TaxID=2486000 RepID=A0ABW1UPZ8_9LACO|nr:rRNA maturation RNase YbeY [Lapidilactobacillus achengensis]